MTKKKKRIKKGIWQEVAQQKWSDDTEEIKKQFEETDDILEKFEDFIKKKKPTDNGDDPD